MSAAEKLKALGADITSDEPFEVLRTEIAVDALVDALPQIVAVVEAAETYCSVLTRSEYETGTTRGALSALEEALS